LEHVGQQHVLPDFGSQKSGHHPTGKIAWALTVFSTALGEETWSLVGPVAPGGVFVGFHKVGPKKIQKIRKNMEKSSLVGG
jgi:hypothetical protein